MQKTFGFSRSFLKIVAVLSMLCDHIAYLFLDAPVYHTEYLILRNIGRVSFVLFSFVLVQGFLSTGNWFKYLGRLFCFAILSEIPFDLAFGGRFLDLQQQNVLFTFCIAILVLAGLLRYEGSFWREAAVVLAGCVLATVLHTDYSYTGILLCVMFYLFRFQKEYQTVLAIMLFAAIKGGVGVVAAIPFCYLYLPQKEGIRMPKYFLYLFYPLHLLLFYGLKMLFVG